MSKPRANSVGRTLAGVGAGVLALICIATGVTGLVEVITGVADPGMWGAMVFLFGLGAGSTVGAVKLLRPPRSKPQLPPADPTEAILSLAAAEGGRVTAIEVAAKTSLTLQQAQHTLKGLADQSLASSIVMEDGVELFQIKGLLPLEAKAQARDILELED